MALLGCPPEAWSGDGFLAARLHPEDVLSDDCEVRLRRDDAHWVWTKVLFEGPRGVLIDVSASRRLEAVGKLAAGIAHEMNTPVQFVNDNVGFLRDSVADLLPLLEGYRKLHETVKKGGKPSAADLAALDEAVADADLEFMLEELPRATDESIKGLKRVALIVKAMKDFAPSEAVVAANINLAIESTLVFARHEYKYVADVDQKLGDVPLVLCHAGELNQVLLDAVLDAARIAKQAKGRSKMMVSTHADGDEVIVQIGTRVLKFESGQVKRTAA